MYLIYPLPDIGVFEVYQKRYFIDICSNGIGLSQCCLVDKTKRDLVASRHTSFQIIYIYIVFIKERFVFRVKSVHSLVEDYAEFFTLRNRNF